MSYTYDTKHTASGTNWSHGRQGHRIEGITIHHWGDSAHLDFYGIVNFLCSSRPANPTSAHYVAQGVDQHGRENRRVACIVAPADTAYHAGNWQANLTEIGIECRPHPTDEDYDVVAELVADLWGTYGVLPLYPHRHWTATACPGVWDVARVEREARVWLASKGKTGGGGGTSAPKPRPKPATKGKVKVDGWVGENTVSAWQRELGTTADGLISSQSSAWRDSLPRVTAVQYVAPSHAKGSRFVVALQRKVGVKPDGLIGGATIAATQRYLKRHGHPRIAVDSVLGNQTARAIQYAINRGEFK